NPIPSSDAVTRAAVPRPLAELPFAIAAASGPFWLVSSGPWRCGWQSRFDEEFGWQHLARRVSRVCLASSQLLLLPKPEQYAVQPRHPICSTFRRPKRAPAQRLDSTRAYLQAGARIKDVSQRFSQLGLQHTVSGPVFDFHSPRLDRRPARWPPDVAAARRRRPASLAVFCKLLPAVVCSALCLINLLQLAAMLWHLGIPLNLLTCTGAALAFPSCSFLQPPPSPAAAELALTPGRSRRHQAGRRGRLWKQTEAEKRQRGGLGPAAAAVEAEAAVQAGLAAGGAALGRRLAAPPALAAFAASAFPGSPLLTPAWAARWSLGSLPPSPMRALVAAVASPAPQALPPHHLRPPPSPKPPRRQALQQSGASPSSNDDYDDYSSDSEDENGRRPARTDIGDLGGADGAPRHESPPPPVRPSPPSYRRARLAGCGGGGLHGQQRSLNTIPGGERRRSLASCNAAHFRAARRPSSSTPAAAAGGDGHAAPLPPQQGAPPPPPAIRARRPGWRPIFRRSDQPTFKVPSQGVAWSAPAGLTSSQTSLRHHQPVVGVQPVQGGADLGLRAAGLLGHLGQQAAQWQAVALAAWKCAAHQLANVAQAIGRQRSVAARPTGRRLRRRQGRLRRAGASAAARRIRFRLGAAAGRLRLSGVALGLLSPLGRRRSRRPRRFRRCQRPRRRPRRGRPLAGPGWPLQHLLEDGVADQVGGRLGVAALHLLGEAGLPGVRRGQPDQCLQRPGRHRLGPLHSGCLPGLLGPQLRVPVGQKVRRVRPSDGECAPGRLHVLLQEGERHLAIRAPLPAAATGTGHGPWSTGLCCSYTSVRFCWRLLLLLLPSPVSQPWQCDAALLHDLVNRGPIDVGHFVELVDADDAPVGQNHGAGFQLPLAALRVGVVTAAVRPTPEVPRPVVAMALGGARRGSGAPRAQQQAEDGRFTHSCPWMLGAMDLASCWNGSAWRLKSRISRRSSCVKAVKPLCGPLAG
uniref:RING-type domain-containing protein n=1 Tax=Macrostomum lignano TaxID=282301 RepID=A0A1I8JQK3_9PLAT